MEVEKVSKFFGLAKIFEKFWIWKNFLSYLDLGKFQSWKLKKFLSFFFGLIKNFEKFWILKNFLSYLDLEQFQKFGFEKFSKSFGLRAI